MSGKPAAAAGDDGLSITERRMHRLVVLVVTGEIDVATGTRLRNRLADGLNDSGIDQVVVDLRSVTLMSSTGIAALVDAHWQADQQRKPMSVVVGDNRAAAHPLHISGVDQILDLRSGLDV